MGGREAQDQYDSQWAAIESIAAKTGCTWLRGQVLPFAGMSNARLVGGVLTLVGQMPKSEGHFYYNAPNDAAGQARRDALAELLYKKGLR